MDDWGRHTELDPMEKACGAHYAGPKMSGLLNGNEKKMFLKYIKPKCSVKVTLIRGAEL